MFANLNKSAIKCFKNCYDQNMKNILKVHKNLPVDEWILPFAEFWLLVCGVEKISKGK